MLYFVVLQSQDYGESTYLIRKINHVDADENHNCSMGFWSDSIYWVWLCRTKLTLQGVACCILFSLFVLKSVFVVNILLVPQVTEIDGRECQDFFTLLSLSSYYGQDQLLNIHTFSSLRAWLLATTTSPSQGQDPTGPAGGASRPLEVGGRGLPSLGGEGATKAASSGGKFANKARKAMIEKACEYCLRVIDLCHRSESYKMKLHAICYVVIKNVLIAFDYFY